MGGVDAMNRDLKLCDRHERYGDDEVFAASKWRVCRC